MDEGLVIELETAIADAGALVVRARKYRRGAGPEGDALLGAALALGDRARRLHRQDALDAASAGPLLSEARGVGERLRALVARVHTSADYRAAVAAHAAGDGPALARLLPAVFAGLEPAVMPGALFAPLAWLRRGRLRPAAEVVAEVCAARSEGLVAEGDDLSPGADPELPAVTLAGDAPSDEPLLLRVAPALPAPLFRLVESGEYLAHAPRVVAPFSVRLAARLERDEDLRVELGPADYARWRDALASALVTAGVQVDEG